MLSFLVSSLVDAWLLEVSPSHIFSYQFMLIILLLGGPRSALGSAVACGILLSVFEGVGVLVSRVFNDSTKPQLPPCELQFSKLLLQISDIPHST